MIYNGSTIYNEGADGGDNSNVALFQVNYDTEAGRYVWPSYSDISAAVSAGKVPMLVQNLQDGSKSAFVLTRYENDQTDRFEFFRIQIAESDASSSLNYVYIESDDTVTVGKFYNSSNSNMSAAYSALTPPIAEGTICMHNGLLYYCSVPGGIQTAEAWTAAHWTRTNITEQIGSVKNGGVLTDAASVNVPNNALSTLATAQAARTLNVNVGSGEVPNFAVEVTPRVDVTLTVTKTVGNTTTTLNPSAAGGNSLTTGKLYQVTCVGSCWTLAEFTVPNP